MTTHVSTDPERVALGLRIRTARKAAGATQKAIASQVGITRSALAEIEGGRRKLPTSEGVALAEALGTSLKALLDDGPPTETTPDPRVTFEQHEALHRAAAACGKAIDRLQARAPAGPQRDRAEGMLTRLGALSRTAADALLTDPTLRTEPRWTFFGWRLVDLYCELVRQVGTLLVASVFDPGGQENWPTEQRWAEAQALYERALDFADLIPVVVPRADHDSITGSRAICLGRLAGYHGQFLAAAEMIESAVLTASDGLLYPALEARELAGLARQLRRHIVTLAEVERIADSAWSRMRERGPGVAGD